MKKFFKGLILIVMMFGHNYVTNQPQSLQEQIQQIHQINVPQFNLLYSIPSAVSIIFIIPLGILYDRYSLKILMLGTISLVFGQLLVALFGSIKSDNSYGMLITGRVSEGVGAQILYMIQGNLASSWMGKLAGLIFILPQIGQIGNVFGTPFIASKYGMQASLMVGFLTCLLSAVACLYLFFYLKKKLQKKTVEETQLATIQTKKLHQVEIHINVGLSENDMKRGVDVGGNASSSSEVSNRNSIIIQNQQIPQLKQPKSLMETDKIFWLMIGLCAVNQCLYFPFLDNANQLLQVRFCVQYEGTGIYLCLPFIAAIIITAIHGEVILHRFQRKTLIVVCSMFPFLGHGIIYLANNCSGQGSTSIGTQLLLMLGFIVFGMGLGSYYSVSFPAIGYMVPSTIRGTAYACLCFFQTISMTIVPIVSGEIIQGESQSALGYKNSSIFFICLSALGILLSSLIYKFGKVYTFRFDDQDHQNDQQSKEQIQKSIHSGKQTSSLVLASKAQIQNVQLSVQK